MKRHKRRLYLSDQQKIEYREAAERFHRQLEPMFRDLVPTGDGYRALRAVSEAIGTAYENLDIDMPERLRPVPRGTMDGYKRFSGD